MKAHFLPTRAAIPDPIDPSFILDGHRIFRESGIESGDIHFVYFRLDAPGCWLSLRKVVMASPAVSRFDSQFFDVRPLRSPIHSYRELGQAL